MPKTQKRFTKGDAVTLFGDWDRKGTAFYRHATVYACGTKRMTLTCAETGDEIGSNFYPLDECVLPRRSEGETVAHALQLAALLLDREREHLQRCIARYPEQVGYVAAIQRELEALHEPRVKRYIAGGE